MSPQSTRVRGFGLLAASVFALSDGEVSAMPPKPVETGPIAGEPSRLPVPASAIAAGLDRLGVVGSVLYVAAHPDDENTRLLAWLHGDRHLETAYVSLTRGEGGQNLIGRELGPGLGLIRTFELLAARRIDGASQFFSRATDFGYSKAAEETLRIWPRDEVLGDLVAVVRAHAPDLIITRFSTSPPNHGHHTASALLAAEAFRLAPDPAAYPEQVKALGAHAPRRLLENKSHWRFKEGEDLSTYLKVDVGTFDPLTGRSFAEVAARSRSQHKSQGFGSAPVFGPQLEYFQVNALADGEATPAGLLDGLDLSWRRFPGTGAVLKAHAALVRGFDVRRPAASVPALIAYREAVLALPDAGLVGHYRRVKAAEAASLIAACLGLVLEATTDAPALAPGEAAEVSVSAIVRAPAPGLEVRIAALAPPVGVPSVVSEPPLGASPTTVKLAVRAPERGAPSPTAPDLRAGMSVAATLVVGKGKGAGHRLVFSLPLTKVTVDPVDGEVRVPVEIVPPVTVTPEAAVLPSVAGAPVTVSLRVEAWGAARDGRLSLVAPEGWGVSPAEHRFSLAAGQGEAVVVTVTPPRGAAEGRVVLKPKLVVGGKEFAPETGERIAYPHLPPLTLRAPASVEVSVFPMARGKVRRVGYIRGADDGVAAALARVGYEIREVDLVAGGAAALKGLDAVVVGIRAHNVDEGLRHHHAALMDYVAKGGVLVWQYNVSSRFRPLGDVPFGPAPLRLGPGRVTDEAAAVRPILGGGGRPHPVLLGPNTIGDADFAGWVQERGLYFAEGLAAPWEPVVALADPGEEPQRGALVVAPHGKGRVIYTGLAFFRQLPAGVPGAFRLFANLLSR